MILYGLGFGYLYCGLKLKRSHSVAAEKIEEVWGDRMNRIAVLYIMAYALILSILAFDLVMSADPQWISTLFAPYGFVKAFYTGLGGLIILAAVVRIRHGDVSSLKPSHFHDLGKLFFAFGLLWADFFYCQFLVIWYGNIPEETSYIIKRTMTLPWSRLACIFETQNTMAAPGDGFQGSRFFATLWERLSSRDSAVAAKAALAKSAHRG